MNVSFSIGGEPQIWTLCFSKVASTRWRSFFAFGRYKHVRAYAFVPGAKLWLFYDVHLTGTTLAVIPDGELAIRAICDFMTNSDLVRIRVRSPSSAPIFGWCVPTMKHLTGVRCTALRPDAFYRACLQQGGIPFEGLNGYAAVSATADGPAVRCGEGTG